MTIQATRSFAKLGLRRAYFFVLVELDFAFASLALLFLFLSMEPSTLPLITRITLTFNVFFWGAVLTLMAYHMFQTIKTVRDPFQRILKDAQPISLDNPIYAIAEELGKPLGMGSVQLLAAEKVPIAITVSDFSGKIRIVFSKFIIANANFEHIRTILLHEFYHIQKEGVAQSLAYVESKTITGRLGWIRLFLLAIIYSVIFTVIPLIGYGAHAQNSVAIMSLARTFNILWLILAILILGLIVVMLAKDTRFAGLPSPDYLHNRELFADAYSSLVSRKPLILKDALVKCGKQAVVSKLLTSNDAVADLGFMNIKQPEHGNIVESRTLKEMFKSKSLGIREIATYAFDLFVRGKFKIDEPCSIGDRIFLTKELERLLTQRVTLIIHENSQSLDMKKHSLPPEVNIYVRKNPEIFRMFLSYVRLHFSDFNLEDSSNELQVDLFHVFLMLLAAIESGYVDLVENA